MANSKYRRILLKISGEGLCSPGGFGIDAEFLGKIATEIKAVVETGVQIALVVGGGNFIRGRDLAKSTHIHAATGHYMGMLGTVINALAIQDTLEQLGVVTRTQSAIAVDRVCEKFIRRRCIRHLEKGRVVILAAGTGNPFFTTDSAAALRAIEIGADVLLKATKVSGVYDSDPLVNTNASLFDTVSFDQVLVDKLNVMDATAIVMCRDNNLPLRIFSMAEDDTLVRAMTDENVGTLVTA